MPTRDATLLLPGLLLAMLAAGTPVSGQTEYTWIGGDGSFVDGNNWFETFSPSGEYDEYGVINNGGVARVDTVLSALNLEQPGQIILGRATGESGTLIVENGGNFSIYTGDGAEENASSGGVNVGEGGVGTLVVEPGGTFNSGYIIVVGEGSTVTLDGSGAQPATLDVFNFSGRASGINVTNGTSLRTIGPNVDITSNTFDIDTGGAYIAEITGATHSTYKTPSMAAADGKLIVEFNGYAPSVTDTWNLVDAPGFSATFSGIEVQGADLPLGQVLTFRAVEDAGSVNGFFGQLGIEQQLVLKVNRDTNELSIVTGDESVAVDGYNIQSALGGLNPANWTSLQDGGVSDWRESSQGGSANMLAELKPTGDHTVTTASPIEVGEVFNLPQPTEWKQEIEDIQFEYYLEDGSVVQAQVVYEGEKRYNDLVLVVDPVDGDAILENQSPLSVSIDGYTIHSDSGSLLPNDGDWLSLEDQGNSTWRESNETANDLTELQSGDSTLLNGGHVFDLGGLFKTMASGGTEDLSFRYLFPGDSEFTDGVVVYRDVDFTEVVGDYNSDGVVNAADYTVWRDTFGALVPPGSGADGNGNGEIDDDDYQLWRQNYGMSSSADTAASLVASVPEPSSVLLLVFSASAAWTRRRRVRPIR